jgi:predicted NBD/HSP70 family sugar kinase
MADRARRESENGCSVAKDSAGDCTSRRRCRCPGGDGNNEFSAGDHQSCARSRERRDGRVPRPRRHSCRSLGSGEGTGKERVNTHPFRTNGFVFFHPAGLAQRGRVAEQAAAIFRQQRFLSASRRWVVRVDTQSTGVNLAGLRDHNMALVLGLLRAAPEGSSRVELAAGTGLTPQAISKIIARLRADGLVAETGHAASTGGKPRTLLRLRPGAVCAAGLAIDRQRSDLLLLDIAGGVRYRAAVPVGLATAAPERVVALLASEVRRALAAAPPGARVPGVGVGCRGPLDHLNGVLHRPAGLRSWDRFPLRDALAAHLDGVPVHVDKDTNVAVLRAAGTSGTAYLHLADGLGAGLLLDGAVYRGARTNAGEFGHQVVQIDGPPCACGGRGCLEALCLAALADGDHAAAARLLGIGAANLVRLLDIGRIVLGGHAVLAEPEIYRDGVSAQLAASLPEPEWQHVEVGLAAPGLPAVAAGAVELVLGPLCGGRLAEARSA